MKRKTIYFSALFVCLLINSCGPKCDKYYDENYLGKEEFIEIESSSVKLSGLNINISYDEAFNTFGKEERRREIEFNDSIIVQYSFDYHGNKVFYDKNRNDSCLRLTGIRFLNNKLKLDFDGFKLDGTTNLKMFSKKYMKAYCNCVFFEQQNRFELYFKLKGKENIAILKFESDYLKGIDIR